MGFTNVKQTKRTAKILMIGPTGSGKTYGGLQLEGPIGAFDGEDGLKAYRDDFDFGIDPFDTIEELNRKMTELLVSPSELASINTVLVDGLTVAWHAALREISEGKQGGLDMRDQAMLKSPWKEFNELVFKLGKRGKNVWATVQAKSNWEVIPGKKPVLKGMKGDVADKIWYAFDLVGYVDVVNGVRVLSVLKSRYPSLFRVGDTIEHFNVKEHFRPIFDGSAKYVEDADQGVAEEIARARKQVQDKIKELGAESRGGRIPDAGVKRLWATAQTSTSIDELANVLSEVRGYEKSVPAAV